MSIILQQIVFLLKALIDVFTRHMTTLHEVLAKKDETIIGLPESVFYTVIGSIVSAGVILFISSLYNKRRERKKIIKERSEYEPFLYQYLTDIAELSERQAELIDVYISHLEAKENIVQGLATVSKASVRYFFQIQPNVIYNSLFLNKTGDAKERALVYSAIINAISSLDSSLENISENIKDFKLQYQSSINNLNEYLDEFSIYHDDVLTNKEKYLVGDESAFYLELNKVITKHQTKETETTNIYTTSELNDDYLKVCKPFHTKAAISLTRILINIRHRFNDAELFRKQQITVFRQTAVNLRSIGQDLRLSIEASQKIPLIK
jgi:hypothetical protein